MSFEYMTKPVGWAFDEAGKITKTQVMIRQDEPYTILTGYLDGDWTDRSLDEAVEAVLEDNFKRLFVSRAMDERVQLIDQLNAKVAEVNAVIEQLQTWQAEVADKLNAAETERTSRFQAIEDKFAILNGSLTEMMVDYYASKEADHETDGDPEVDHVDGSDSSTNHETRETE